MIFRDIGIEPNTCTVEKIILEHGLDIVTARNIDRISQILISKHHLIYKLSVETIWGLNSIIEMKYSLLVIVATRSIS